MLGLKVYNYVDLNNIQFYRAQKMLAKKMDVLDWIPGSSAEETMEVGESPQDRARRVNPAELAMIVPYSAPERLVQVHPGSSSRGLVTRMRRRRRMRKKRMKSLGWKVRSKKGQRASLKNLKPHHEKNLCG